MEQYYGALTVGLCLLAITIIVDIAKRVLSITGDRVLVLNLVVSLVVCTSYNLLWGLRFGAYQASVLDILWLLFGGLIYGALGAVGSTGIHEYKSRNDD